MLLAFVIGGLAAAIAAPVLLSSDAEDDVPEPRDVADDPGDVESLLHQAADAGDLLIEGGEEVHVLEEFEPGVDSFDVELDDADAVIETGWDEDGVPFFSADTGDGVLTARFPGLSDVPVDDVTFTVASPGDDPPTALTLSQVLDLGALRDTEPQVVTFDGGDEHPFDPVFGIVGTTLDDLGALSPIDPVSPDDPDVFPDLLPDLDPLDPEPGDAPQTASEPLDGAVPLAPASPDLRDV